MSHYATLGVERDASPDDIKAAYRRLSKQHHPDREGGDAEKMQAINAAYACLSDPERRDTYDRLGCEPQAGSIEHAVTQLVRSAFLQALNQGSVDDIARLARAHVTDALSERQRALGANERGLAQIERRRKLVRLREGAKGKPDLFAALAEEQIAGFRRDIANIKVQIDIITRAAAVLDDYESPASAPVAGATYAGIDALLAARAFGGRW